MKTIKIIAVFAIMLVIASLIFVSALKTETKTSKTTTSESSSNSILPVLEKQGSFIMWTNDGKNLIWGTYLVKASNPCNPNGYCLTEYIPYYSGTFQGKDNQGRIVQGTFNQDTFNGYYISGNVKKSFFGSFDTAKGIWKARDLFGQKESSGEYKFFPFSYAIQDKNVVYTVK